jgi:hypothetical protein
MKAFKRYRQLPAREREEVMQQPFTRSLLVVSQAPRATPPARPQLPERSAATNGHTQTPVADTVEEYLKERGLPTEQLETTQLLNAALDFQGQTTTTEEDEDLEADTPLIEHEATPLDDILDAPRAATPEVEDSDVVDGISQKEIDAEAVEEYERALNEIARLEDLTRSLTRELQAARTVAEQAVQNAGAAAPQGARGWDYFEQMARYLKADESQRTPESLARRAASLPNDHGREVIAYLSMFLQATLNHMQALG